jgi:signal transduction histidine kinase
LDTVLKFNIKKVSIKWRLFIYFGIFTAVVIAFLWIFQIVFLDDFYKSIKVNEIKSNGDQISMDVNSTNLQSEIDTVAQNSEVNILVTNMVTSEVYQSSTVPGNFLRNLNKDEKQNLYEQAKNNGGEYLERYPMSQGPRGAGFMNPQIGNAQSNVIDGQARQIQQPMFGGGNHDDIESMVYAKISNNSNGEAVLVLLSTVISPVNATVETLRKQLIIITFIMLGLAVIIAFIISKVISKPIIEINKSAKALAGSNYNIHFDESGYREISELASTLNYAAKELSTVESLRRELIANISHDLRTPLTLITGYSEVMRDIPNEYKPENVQIIIDEAKRLSNIVNDILDLSKLQSGTQELNRERFSLTNTLRIIVDRFVKMSRGYHIEFIFDCDAVVDADELRISQVIYNLLSNAINYTGKDKSVRIVQHVQAGKVHVDVVDTGEGISEDKLPYIWDRYYKVDKSHKRATVGTGLGLSIVKAVLDMHGAQFGVNSTLGQGSVFWFELPLAID